MLKFHVMPASLLAPSHDALNADTLADSSTEHCPETQPKYCNLNSSSSDPSPLRAMLSSSSLSGSDDNHATSGNAMLSSSLSFSPDDSLPTSRRAFRSDSTLSTISSASRAFGSDDTLVTSGNASPSYTRRSKSQANVSVDTTGVRDLPPPSQESDPESDDSRSEIVTVTRHANGSISSERKHVDKPTQNTTSTPEDAQSQFLPRFCVFVGK